MSGVAKATDWIDYHLVCTISVRLQLANKKKLNPHFHLNKFDHVGDTTGFYLN